MKKLLSTLAFGIVFSIQAQFEIKINPIMTALGEADISGEYIINDALGVELSLQPFFGKSYEFSNLDGFVGKQSGMGEKLRAKYYYEPSDGGDEQYVSAFVSNLSNSIVRDFESYNSNTQTDATYTETFKQSYIGIGFEYGYKLHIEPGFVLEFALGVGAYLTNNSKIIIDPEDLDHKGYDKKPQLPFFFSGKFGIGYRFGEL